MARPSTPASRSHRPSTPLREIRRIAACASTQGAWQRVGRYAGSVPQTVRLSSTAVARALWLLGLTDPVSVEEIREAWKRRVARAHPDRRSDHPEAAHRLTAAFNDARDVLERWAATGQPWPRPGLRVVQFQPDEDELDEDETADEPARRVPTPDELRGERRSGLRPGDLV